MDSENIFRAIQVPMVERLDKVYGRHVLDLLRSTEEVTQCESQRVLELTSIFIVSHLTNVTMIGVFMGFLRIFAATQPKLSCFINNKIDAFQNKIFIKYKKLMVSYLP